MKRPTIPKPKAFTTLSLPVTETTAPRLWVRRYPATSHPEGAPHFHRFFELVFIESGEGSQAIDGRRFSAAPGKVYWLAPGQLHDAVGLHGTTTWIIAFGEEVLSPERSEGRALLGPTHPSWLMPFALAREQGRCHAALPLESHPVWLARLNQLAQELERRPLGYAEAARALLQLLLLDVTRLMASWGEAPARAQRPLLEAVFDFIERNYQRPIGLQDVARAVGRSPAYLTDKVRRETGQPVLGWITERRMAEARRLLLVSEAPLERIATAVGYGDVYHFARQFRRFTGLPPHAWRKAQRAADACPEPAPGAPKDTALPPKDSAL
jgi:AraC family transcriptional regulator, transcriptional activator of pobA